MRLFLSFPRPDPAIGNDVGFLIVSIWPFIWYPPVHFCSYFLLYFPFTFADNITLSIEPAVPFNQTVTVAWNIVNGKPPKKWDIRLAQDKEDVGELLRSIQSSDSSGTADITITKANETG